MPFPPRQSGDHWLGDTGSVGGSNGRGNGRTSVHPAMYTPEDSASGPGATGNWGPYSLPAASSYSTTMPSFAALPETRPLEYLARRRRPRWGLRFLFLLVVAGGAAYFLKPYVPWIAVRVTPVEQVVRAQITKYRGIIEPMIGLGEPPSTPTPATAPAAPPPVAPVAARPVVDAPARPGIEPIVPRATRGAVPAAGVPTAPVAIAPRGMANGRVVVPPRGAALPATGAVAGRPAVPGARAGARYQGGAGTKARPMSRAAARRAAKAARLAMAARARAARAAAITAAAAERTGESSVAEVASPESAAAQVAEVAEVPAPPAPVAPAKEPAAVAAAEKISPPPAEDDRSVNSLVQSASRSGDELERLMAGAVRSGAETRPAGRNDSPELERKLADVQKPRAAASNNNAGISRQPLSRADISMVMQEVQKNVRGCFRQHGKGGVADVKVDVAPEGNVIGSVIRGDLQGTPTGACVEARLKAAVFPPSTGMRFDYRLLVK